MRSRKRKRNFEECESARDRVEKSILVLNICKVTEAWEMTTKKDFVGLCKFKCASIITQEE